MQNEWRCGQCGKEYDTDSLIKLKHIKAVETDTNPIQQHGYTPVCECGYIFHKDKWHKTTTVEIEKDNLKSNVKVSTVFLELDHYGYWYETMIFVEDTNKGVNISCDYQDRYKTKEEAEKVHETVVSKLKKGLYKIVPSEYELIIEND